MHEAVQSRRIGLVLAGVLLIFMASCGQAFESVGTISSISKEDVCAVFENAKTLCIDQAILTEGSPLPAVGDCIRVRFQGESARVLSAVVVTCSK